MPARLSLALVRISAVLLASACGTVPQGGYPGDASVATGAPALIRIERTGSSETDPATLYVPPGTEVTWQNRTRQAVHIRFDDRVPEVCGSPVRFARSTGGDSYASDYLNPFEEARLCFLRPGRYDFIVSIPGGNGDGGLFLPGTRTPPAKYGTVVVGP